MDASFFSGAPDQASDPQGFQRQQAIAQALMQRGQGQGGTMAGGQYVPPSTGAYVNQALSGAAGAYKMNQLRDASRASDILNGGTGQNGIQKIGSWIGGLLGGA